MKLNTAFAIISGLSILLISPAAFTENKLKSSVKVQEKIEKAAVSSQQKIDKLADSSQQMLEEYKVAVGTAKSLKTYNDYIEKIIQSQQEELASFDAQLLEIETTTHEVVPLMERMLETLDEFVKLDLPFLEKERSNRLATLKEMMHQANVSTSEKFRRILEAYQVETEYGRTIEAYRAELVMNDSSRTVDFMRLGRVALMYQTLDGTESGHWNRETGAWEMLPKEYRQEIRKGLNIARKRAAPNLLKLPIKAPEKAK